MPPPKPQPQPQPLPSRDAPAVIELDAPPPEATSDDGTLAALLDHVDLTAPVSVSAPASVSAPVPVSAPVLRTARVASLTPTGALVTFRGAPAPVPASLDDGVDRALVQRAYEQGDAVLAEIDPATGDVVLVGVVQTRLPDRIDLRAREITLDAEREILLRAGRAAIRIREDGDVEVVGSRILTMSRGLFRIVGRVLRLN